MLKNYLLCSGAAFWSIRRRSIFGLCACAAIWRLRWRKFHRHAHFSYTARLLRRLQRRNMQLLLEMLLANCCSVPSRDPTVVKWGLEERSNRGFWLLGCSQGGLASDMTDLQCARKPFDKMRERRLVFRMAGSHPLYIYIYRI
jgi:hypothetical protein